MASSTLARIVLSFRGVQYGSNLRCLGQPIITRVDGSEIRLGDNIVLASHSSGTALGVRSPVILRCLSPNSLITIGSDTGLSGTVVCAAVEVSIGKRCLIGSDVMIFDTDFHALVPLPRRYLNVAWNEISSPVYIGDDVFIGARSIVCKGVTIGNGSVVGAGSVVTRDIPAMKVAAGNPARVIGEVAT